MRSGFKTYVLRGDRLVDVTEAVRAPPEPRVAIHGDAGYQNLWVPGFEYGRSGDRDAGRAPERGTPKMVDLSSRSKHRRYMQERGLTHASDFGMREDGSLAEGSAWDRAQKHREALAAGTDQENNQRIHKAVVDSVKKLEAGYRPSPPPAIDGVADGATAVVYPEE